MAWADGNGFTLPLAALVIYDSWVHSGRILDSIRAMFPESPPAAGGDERTWVSQYVDARHNWLANHPRQVLHGTVYRTRCFQREIARDNWKLELVPIRANGVEVDAGDAPLEDAALLAVGAATGLREFPVLVQPEVAGLIAEGTEPLVAATAGQTPYVGQLVSITRRQHEQFHEFGENDGPLRAQIRRYWEELGFEFPGVSTAWSAVFVSWCVRTAGAASAEFRFSTAHSRFVFRAIQNQLAGTGLFRGRQLSEYGPKPGDIIHNNRNGQRITYTFAANHEAYESHSAIVVEVGEDDRERYALTIGGNEGDSIRTKRVVLTEEGFVRQRERDPYICVIQNLK
jgi:hypothetical protein